MVRLALRTPRTLPVPCLLTDDHRLVCRGRTFIDPICHPRRYTGVPHAAIDTQHVRSEYDSRSCRRPRDRRPTHPISEGGGHLPLGSNLSLRYVCNPQLRHEHRLTLP
eukprot:4722092-Prymnesium_polylepis.1